VKRSTRTFNLLGAMTLAILACAAMTASAASARSWTVAGSTLSGSESTACKLAAGGSAILKGGSSIVFHATQVKCVGTPKIENVAGKGVDSGKLEFSGVTITKPLGCSVVGGVITTIALTSELIELPGDSHGYDLFKPASGEKFMTIETTGTCAGTYPVKGSIAGQGNVWGTEVAEQPLAFSPSIDLLTGHQLKFGGEPLTMELTMLTALAGARAGMTFGAH
jgi:hypothetical protein